MSYGLGYIPSPVDDRDAIMNMQHEAVPDEYKVNNVDSVVIKDLLLFALR